MKRLIVIFTMIGIFTACFNSVYGEECREFELKQGIRKDAVNKKYGEPVISKKVKSGFLPIPKEKVLYKIDDTTYMILLFYSGRLRDITVLEDVDSEKALSLFME